MTTPDLVWGSLFLAGTAFEIYALRNARANDTLSEETRRVFRVRTKPGKIVFTTVWVGFSTWFLGHILDWWA